ncbi:disintegrin and metalloproteinase domain-containing protein 8a [Myripristis murdjan]|uniref:disintegrin and metalloproteinase domain-containing protein 8a n=1 Tax=Myripristis murdjan TaxID=586833 RepID=UPI001175CE80|nr:disintegrin and metalloproteinase domain-containing protein 8 [Myripristis murdjan]
MRFGYFICVCISSWGVIVGSLRTLPHVMEYESVIPQKVKDAFQRTHSAQQTYPDVVEYCLTIAGQNCTLHLEKNRNLVGKNFSVTHYTEHGTQVTTTPDEGHCYYHGHVVEVEDSSASMDLCSGMNGFVRLQDQVYLIEPLAGAEAGQQAASQSHEADEEGLHAVYNYKHLRRKRSSCSQGNTTTFYDHGSRPSGLFQLSSLKSRAQNKARTGKPRIVEMVLVVDNTEYKKFGSKKAIEARALQVVNHVDKLYRPVGLRVMLVGLEIWTYRDQIEVSSDPEVTLMRFLDWRQQSLLRRTKHDNAQLITAVDFNGLTVGLANTKAMCTSNSGAVNEDQNPNPVGVASTIAHELGHNLGLSHDNAQCICGSSTCIMAESIGFVYPEMFSSCSQQQLSAFLEEVNPACLLDTPSTDRIYGGPVCGNAFLEPGEECDCGTVEECKNPCCNATTCKLKAGAQCAQGECCHNCQLRPTGTMCRQRAGDCDLAEYCTGFSASCPADAFTQNGLPCNRGKGYCYNGQCPSHEQHCKRLWGPDANVAADACFYKGRNCRKTLFGQRCSDQDLTCGKLFCTGGWEFPVTSRKSIITLTNGETCNEATMDPKDHYPADLPMVPTGTRCGNKMVCYDNRCQDIKNIKVYGTDDCSAKCNNHGVCNHERNCHCNPGWAPPFCDVKFSELPEGTDVVVTAVSVAIGVLLILILVIASLTCCVRKRRPAKRPLHSTSGQSNPLFQSGNSRGSPHIKPTHISQPTFVESSATQACTALFSATNQTRVGAIVPCRAAPQPPKKVPAVPQPSKTEQAVRPPMPPPVVPCKPVFFEAKPLPPSKPLPPLGAKPIMKSKPPVPPAKPCGTPPVLKQLAVEKAALMPPRKPR